MHTTKHSRVRNSGVHTHKHARIPHTKRTVVKEDQRFFILLLQNTRALEQRLGNGKANPADTLDLPLLPTPYTLLHTLGTPEHVVWRSVGNLHANNTPSWRGLGRQCRTLYQAVSATVSRLPIALGALGLPDEYSV
jgi:hypothetical protein